VQEPTRLIRVRQFVRREYEPCHRAAHRNVVAGVRDEIHVHIVAQRFGQSLGVGVAAKHLRDARQQNARLVRRHPVAGVDVLGRNGRREQVAQMTPERSRAEPHDSARMFRAPCEATDNTLGYEGGPRDTLINGAAIQ
jgi:hypothetical protein